MNVQLGVDHVPDVVVPVLLIYTFLRLNVVNLISGDVHTFLHSF